MCALPVQEEKDGGVDGGQEAGTGTSTPALGAGPAMEKAVGAEPAQGKGKGGPGKKKKGKK